MKKKPLHELIEQSQGMAHISDSVDLYSQDVIEKIVVQSISWHMESIRILAEYNKIPVDAIVVSLMKLMLDDYE